MAAKIIPFPVKKHTNPPPCIDWENVELKRSNYFPHVPKVATLILRYILEAKPDSRKWRNGEWLVALGDLSSEEPRPRYPLAVTDDSDVIEILDRLERFGGQLAWGRLECHLTRNEKRPQLKLLHQISNPAQRAFMSSMGSHFDHRVESSQWRVLGKELCGLNLLVFLIEKDEHHYLGLYDRGSGIHLLERLRIGHSIQLRATVTTVYPTSDW